MTIDAPSLLPFALAAIALTVVTLSLVMRPLFRERRRLIACMVAVAALVLPLLYAKLGALRPDGNERDELVAQVAHNARDARGWVLLARLELGADRFAEAAYAYEHALAHPKAAADTALWCEYADALALAQGGKLAGRPREIIGQALARDPSHRQALEMAGSAALEAREYDVAAAYWRMLVVALPEGSSERRELSAAIAKAELMATANLH